MEKAIVQKVVMAGVVANRDRILILQRSSTDDSYPNLWELPSGKKEPREEAVDALIREIREETGLKAVPVQPIGVFNYLVEKPEEIRDVTQICFLVQPTSLNVVLSSEHQAYRWITAAEIDSFNLSDETEHIISLAFKKLVLNP